MPTYTYSCESCKHTRDVIHKMSETPTIHCDNCGKEMDKIISAPPQVTYKGQWFKNSGKY